MEDQEIWGLETIRRLGLRTKHPVICSIVPQPKRSTIGRLVAWHKRSIIGRSDSVLRLGRRPIIGRLISRQNPDLDPT